MITNDWNLIRALIQLDGIVEGKMTKAQMQIKARRAINMIEGTKEYQNLGKEE